MTHLGAELGFATSAGSCGFNEHVSDLDLVAPSLVNVVDCQEFSEESSDGSITIEPLSGFFTPAGRGLPPTLPPTTVEELSSEIDVLKEKMDDLDGKIQQILGIVSQLVDPQEHERRVFSTPPNRGLKRSLSQLYLATPSGRDTAFSFEGELDQTEKMNSLRADSSVREIIRWYLIDSMNGVGKFVEIFILFLILLACIFYVLSTYGYYFEVIEWIFTIFFTVEYLLRIYAHENRQKYVLSFYGIIDLISIIPAYIDAFFYWSFISGMTYVRCVRAVRAFRFFRYMEKEGSDGNTKDELLTRCCCFQISLLAVQIIKSTITMFILIFVFSGFYFSLEGPDSGIESVETFFQTVYFMVVSVSTVGYGEIHPKSWGGQLVMLFIIPICLVILPLQYKQIGEAYEKLREKEEHAWRRKRHFKKQNIRDLIIQ